MREKVLSQDSIFLFVLHSKEAVGGSFLGAFTIKKN